MTRNKNNQELNAICELKNEDEIVVEAKVKDNLLYLGKSKGLLFGLPIKVKYTFLVKGLTTSNGDPLQ